MQRKCFNQPSNTTNLREFLLFLGGQMLLQSLELILKQFYSVLFVDKIKICQQF